MTLICGIDPGTKGGGWSLIEPSGALHAVECVETHPGDKVGDNQRRLGLWLRAITKPMRLASVIVIEFPSMGVGQQQGMNPDRARWSAKAMAQTVAAAAAAMGAAFALGGSRKILTPAPRTWRCRLGGEESSEEQIHAALTLRYPLIAAMRRGARPHCFDATGCALYGRLVLRLDHTDRNQETATP